MGGRPSDMEREREGRARADPSRSMPARGVGDHFGDPIVRRTFAGTATLMS